MAQPLPTCPNPSGPTVSPRGTSHPFAALLEGDYSSSRVLVNFTLCLLRD